MKDKKIKSKIIKRGNSNTVVIGHELAVLLGRKIEAEDVVSFEKLSKNKVVLTFLDKKDIPNE